MSAGERACWVIVLTGVAMVAAPFVAEEALAPMGDARFAMVFVGLIASLSAFVTTFFLRKRNRVRRHLLAGRGLLVCWKYSEGEWRAFAGEETQRQAGSKRTLLTITAVIMAVATIGFMTRDLKAGIGVGVVLFVVWVICWIAARASVRAQARHQTGPTPEVRIGREGLLIGDELHDWDSWGSSLEDCAFREGTPPLLEFTYAMISGNATVRRNETVRVPVPAGKETEAHEVLRQLSGGSGVPVST